MTTELSKLDPKDYGLEESLKTTKYLREKIKTL